MPPKRSHAENPVPDALKERNSQFSALTQVSGLISRTGNLAKAINGTLDQLLAVTGADIGSIHLRESPSGDLQLIASRGLSKGFICAEERIPAGDCLCGEAAGTGEIVSSSDLASEPRLSRAACRDEALGSLICIPLRARDRTLGILTLYANRSHAFSKLDPDWLVLIGQQIGIAIENALLYARVRDSAVKEERERIAQEIHDGIAQSLAYLNLETKKLEKSLKTHPAPRALAELGQIREVIRGTYEEVRELLVDFRMKFKNGEDLRASLDRYLKEFGERTGLRARLACPESLPPLTDRVQHQIFRVVQEALSNVRKHASAREVAISISRTGGRLDICVRDDGSGFDPRSISRSAYFHQGLAIMRERVESLHGKIRLDSVPGRGTTVRVSVPLDAAQE